MPALLQSIVSFTLTSGITHNGILSDPFPLPEYASVWLCCRAGLLAFFLPDFFVPVALCSPTAAHTFTFLRVFVSLALTVLACLFDCARLVLTASVCIAASYILQHSERAHCARAQAALRLR